VSGGRAIAARVVDQPGFARTFERELAGTTIDALAPALPLLLDTLAVLGRELVEPIKATLGLVSVTGDGRFHRARTPGLRDWVLQAPPPAHMPRPASEWPLITEVPELTPAVLEAWIRRALAEPSPDGATTWFDDLRAAETRVRLPGDFAADEIDVEGIRVPVERRADGSAWVAGAPGATWQPPVVLRVVIREEILQLSLGFCWSLWSEPGSPGRALVDRVAGQIAALGWDDLGWDDEEEPGAGPPTETVAGGTVALGERVRRGANDAVALGWRFGDRAQRFLVTLTGAHGETRSEVARKLAFPFAGVAALEAIAAPDPPLTYDDALIEALPGGRAASALAPIGERALAAIGAQVARILVPVHAAGQALVGIHPDLIFVDDGAEGRPRVTGLCPRGPLFAASARAPARGPSSYSLPYMGPERVSLEAPVPAADVFALCAVLHHLGTGAHPFGTLAELPALVGRLLRGEPDPWPGGGAFGEILARGMAREAGARPSAAELADALEALV
jgi:hypothetical protein